MIESEDYFFIVEPKSVYNTTGKHELHNIDSVEPILIGFWVILRALLLEFRGRYYGI
jgi:hypothetical protein